jgi:hypothetical protein
MPCWVCMSYGLKNKNLTGFKNLSGLACKRRGTPRLYIYINLILGGLTGILSRRFFSEEAAR